MCSTGDRNLDMQVEIIEIGTDESDVDSQETLVLGSHLVPDEASEQVTISCVLIQLHVYTYTYLHKKLAF